MHRLNLRTPEQGLLFFLLLQAKATGEPSCRRNGLVLFCDLSGWLQLAKAKGTVGYSQGYSHPQGTG